jgi:hypothetical protein
MTFILTILVPIVVVFQAEPLFVLGIRACE